MPFSSGSLASLFSLFWSLLCAVVSGKRRAFKSYHMHVFLLFSLSGWLKVALLWFFSFVCLEYFEYSFQVFPAFYPLDINPLD
jgi:hypothetical protein